MTREQIASERRAIEKKIEALRLDIYRLQCEDAKLRRELEKQSTERKSEE